MNSNENPKLRIFSILGFFLVLLMCKKPSEKITIEDIIFQNLNSGGEAHALELKFMKDGSYISAYRSPGIEWYNEGKWSKFDEKISLKPSICKVSKNDAEQIECERTLGSAECSIKELDDSYDFQYHFVCESKENNNLIGNQSNRILVQAISSKPYKSGTEKKINGIALILTGPISGTTSDNAKFREKPSKASPEIRPCETFDGPCHEFIPKNSKINVYAKTKMKEKISNWDDHWYYIEFLETRGWIYGAFLKLL